MAAKQNMDVFLAIVSRREVRKYTDQPLPLDALWRILQAGRATGSSQNRQPWRFYVIRNREVLNQLAETVYEPANIRGCQVAFAIVMTRPRAFDAGRVVQNMGLAAWGDGIGTCPNTPKDMDAIRRLLDLEPAWDVPTILSAGYPAEPLRPATRDTEVILARINRKPLEELTHWID